MGRACTCVYVYVCLQINIYGFIRVNPDYFRALFCGSASHLACSIALPLQLWHGFLTSTGKITSTPTLANGQVQHFYENWNTEDFDSCSPHFTVLRTSGSCVSLISLVTCGILSSQDTPVLRYIIYRRCIHPTHLQRKHEPIMWD